MKKLITILLLSPLFSMAQPLLWSSNDSSKVKINVSIQARDAEYIGEFIAFKQEYDLLFDALKSKMRIANPPLNQTLVSVDSISVLTWLSVATHIRKDYIAIQGGVFTRLDAILRARNNAYMTRVLNLFNTSDISQYTDRRKLGRYNIRRSEN
jgi:hypothetical protein